MILPKGTINGVPVWTQTGDSDIKGDLWASFGLDTSWNDGTMCVAKRTILNTGTSDVPSITGVPIAFINTSFSIATFAGASNVGYSFKNDATMTGTFTKDVTAGAPTTVDSSSSDAVLSNSAIYLSSKASGSSFVSLYKRTLAGVWSEIPTTESQAGAYTNMLCTYGTRTYMSSNFSKIISLDSADAISYSSSFTLSVGSNSNDPQSAITKLLPADDRIFILCLNIYGGQGHVYEWDGSNPQGSGNGLYTDHRLETAGALAGVMFEGTPYIMDVEGKLLKWNGGTFVEVATLNRWNNKPLVYSNAYSALNNRFIHPNGMTVKDGKILILIDNKNADFGSTIEETINSGVYEFDPHVPSKGLIHKYPICTNKAVDQITDYGQIRVAQVGALKNMNIPSTASGANGTMFMGAGYYAGDLTTKYGIFYDDRNDTLQKAGYLTSTKMRSGVLTSSWTKITTFFKKLSSTNDKIVLKYRVSDVSPTEATIAWTSPTTFTTTTNISSYWTSGTGGEVEVIQGAGSGKCSHITSIVNNAGTYTVTVDETYTGASGSGKARFQNWVKKDTINNTLRTFQPTGLGVVSSWIQLKVWMLFTGSEEIEKLVVSENINQKIE